MNKKHHTQKYGRIFARIVVYFLWCFFPFSRVLRSDNFHSTRGIKELNSYRKQGVCKILFFGGGGLPSFWNTLPICTHQNWLYFKDRGSESGEGGPWMSFCACPTPLRNIGPYAFPINLIGQQTIYHLSFNAIVCFSFSALFHYKTHLHWVQQTSTHLHQTTTNHPPRPRNNSPSVSQRSNIPPPLGADLKIHPTTRRRFTSTETVKTSGEPR